jgi:hypothetical protein
LSTTASAFTSVFLAEILKAGAGAELPISTSTSTSTIDAALALWALNGDQLRQIFGFYADVTLASDTGRAIELMSLGRLKAMLGDFKLVPQYVHVEAVMDLYRGCKLWEWRYAHLFASVRRSQATTRLLSGSDVSAGWAPTEGISVLGFIEVLARVSEGFAKVPRDAVAMLLQLMDISDAKKLLIQCGRTHSLQASKRFTYSLEN